MTDPERVEIDGKRQGGLDDYARLNEPATRRDVERRGNFFIAEGELVVRELIANRHRWPIRSVLVTPAKRDHLADVLDDLDVPVLVEPLDRLREIAGFDVHRGVLASADRGTPLTPDQALAARPRLVVAMEAVNDHENVGSLFRNAAAFGAGAVLLDHETADPLYRRSVRVSLGHVLRIPFARTGTAGTTGTSTYPAGYTVVALTPRGDTTIDELAASPPDHAILVVGAEGPGLSDETLANADVRVRIPIDPTVDSLNLATAAAIALHRLST